MPELTPTRSAYLELMEERTSMEEGYRFLDEKRLVLVTEILQQLANYDEIMAEFRQSYDLAAQSLKRAVARHGLDGLEHYPPVLKAWGDLHRESRSVLGLDVQDTLLENSPPVTGESAINASPEAEEARQQFAHLIPLAAILAGITGNLVRLQDEYQKTSRRARALEDVLLPEINQTLAQLDTALEEMDKEELIRVHHAKHLSD